jgi:hypothetical protein
MPRIARLHCPARSTVILFIRRLPWLEWKLLKSYAFLMNRLDKKGDLRGASPVCNSRKQLRRAGSGGLEKEV